MTGKQLDGDPVRWTALLGDSPRRLQNDAGFDVPRTTHPDCEVSTFGVFDLTISTFLVWSVWKLVVLTISSI
jgi:hypothetical protein